MVKTNNDAVKIGNIDFTIDNSLVSIWQYDNAPNLKGLIANKNNFNSRWIEDVLSDFMYSIFDIRTADSNGLSIWGKILGVERPQYINDDNILQSFTDDMYRKLLLGRIMKFNSNGSVKSINDYLQFIFEDKLVFAIDNYDMTMKILFYYNATTEDLAVIDSDGFLPKPVGVKVTYSVVPPNQTFGFAGSDLTGFDTGTFFDSY